MKITIDIDVCVTFYHKHDLKELVVDRHIKQEYNEESEEYLNLCRESESDIGFPREENKEKFDRMFSEILCMKIRQEWDNRLRDIIESVKKAFLDDNVNGYVELCGYILNITDFCAMSVDRFDIRVNKS